MPTMNVNLTPEMAEFVEDEMTSGDYASASELVRDALRLLRRERDMEREKAAILRREVLLGLEEVDRGQFSERTVEEILQSVLQGRE